MLIFFGSVRKKKPAKRAAKKKRAATKKTSAPRKTAARKVAKGSGRNEARAWLAKNKNRHGFASNRFGDNSQALGFVRRLYQAGASMVSVSGAMREPWRIKEEGGPYADSLVVRFPKSKADRVEAAAGIAQPDRITRKGTTLRLWWD